MTRKAADLGKRVVMRDQGKRANTALAVARLAVLLQGPYNFL